LCILYVVGQLAGSEESLSRNWRVVEVEKVRRSRRVATKVRLSLLSIVVLLVILCVFGVQPAQATLVTLSTHSSDSAVAASELDATLAFSVVGTTLDLVVSNETGLGGEMAFAVSQIYFNCPDSLDDVDGLLLAGVVGSDPSAFSQWKKDTSYSENAYNADGFGRFDMRVTDGGQHVIEAGESYTFTFSISGTQTYTDADFGTLMSDTSPPSGGTEMLAAISFTQGGPSGDIGALGATNVPEPATICLLALGGLMLRRRKRA